MLSHRKTFGIFRVQFWMHETPDSKSTLHVFTLLSLSLSCYYSFSPPTTTHTTTYFFYNSTLYYPSNSTLQINIIFFFFPHLSLEQSPLLLLFPSGVIASCLGTCTSEFPITTLLFFFTHRDIYAHIYQPKAPLLLQLLCSFFFFLHLLLSGIFLNSCEIFLFCYIQVILHLQKSYNQAEYKVCIHLLLF